MTNSTDRRFRQLLVASLIVFFLIVLGTGGYMLLEGWSLVESFYMTILSVSTTGFREVRPLSVEGQLFTVFLIVFGLLSIAYVAGRVAQFFLEYYFFRRRSMDAKLKRLKQHHIVCGFGRMGRHICSVLSEAHRDFVVVERSDSGLDELRDFGYLHIIGDATSDEVLLKAGVEVAEGLIAVVSSDPENVFTCLTAKSLNPQIKIVARALDEGTEAKLRKAGADRVVKPYELVGRRMAQLVLRPSIVEFIESIGQTSGQDISMEEIAVQTGSGLAGLNLAESPLRRELNIIVIAVRKAEGEFLYNPPSDTVIEAGDRLMAVGDMKALQGLTALCSERGR
ncbi:MAG: potassium channel family protein [Spirochaetota bacterium]